MKKLCFVAPTLVITGTIALCLSADAGHGPLSAVKSHPDELLLTTQGGYQTIIHTCPDGKGIYTTCITGEEACGVATCQPATEALR